MDATRAVGEVRDRESFAGLLRSHRVMAGLTQEELAERAGLSPRGLAYLEAGQRTPNARTARQLAAALELDTGPAIDFRLTAFRSRQSR
jgi:transcriptional regulator with XRE-family HTH domain